MSTKMARWITRTRDAVIDALGTPSNARYDVNGDGTVNFLDVVLVFDNQG